jgi:hypothetical protein
MSNPEMPGIITTFPSMMVTLMGKECPWEKIE